MANVAKCSIEIDNDGDGGVSVSWTGTHHRCPYEVLPSSIGQAVLGVGLEYGWRKDWEAVTTLAQTIAYIDADPDAAEGAAWHGKEKLADVIRAVQAWAEADAKEAPNE
jgi:hypothetical protein